MPKPLRTKQFSRWRVFADGPGFSAFGSVIACTPTEALRKFAKEWHINLAKANDVEVHQLGRV